MDSEDYKDWRRGLKQRRLDDFRVESKKGALNRSHLTNQRLLNGADEAVNTSNLLQGEEERNVHELIFVYVQKCERKEGR